jgi:Tat protein translocase TatB subunit
MNVGPLEILVIAIFGLIVFGPRRLPDIARTVGKAFAQVRRSTNDLRGEFESGFEEVVRPSRPIPPDRKTPLDTRQNGASGSSEFPPPGPR